GIRTVAMYAECDATAIFVKKADEAHLVGPGPVQGFLDMQAIVDLAKRSGADGIHPGYGFLSENADFAKLCEASGITFIGPSPEAIRLMGNKVQAREIARKAGVPIVPGTEKSVTHPTEALSFAARTGYPLMVKASMGGGGRGLHVVRNDQELLSQMEVARREALSSFGNGEIFLEKYIDRSHHIEFQLLADRDRRGPPPGILPGGRDAAGVRHSMPDQRRGSAEQLQAVHRHRDRLFLTGRYRRAHRRHGVQGLHDPPLLRRSPGQAGRAGEDLGRDGQPGPPLAGGVRAPWREDDDPLHEADHGGPGLSGGPVRHR